MEREPIMRIMEKKDLFDVPSARKEFEKHAKDGNYFFFVIEDQLKNVIGYLIAEKSEEMVCIKILYLPDFLREEIYFVGLIRKKLYDYLRAIKKFDGDPLIAKYI